VVVRSAHFRICGDGAARAPGEQHSSRLVSIETDHEHADALLYLIQQRAAAGILSADVRFKLVEQLVDSLDRRYLARGPTPHVRFRTDSLEATCHSAESIKGNLMNTKRQITACAVLAALAATSVGAVADDHAYTEGPVVNVAAIRTEYGKFDDYMKYLDTTWKAEQEAAKKAGYIISYRVVTVEARGENDPDIYLVINYKNWAAFDGATAKADAIAKQVEGSLSTSNQAAVDRAKIRRVLGSWTGQELDLK
jgi:hypothetical protein